jgi:adenylate kinase family enzyme
MADGMPDELRRVAVVGTSGAGKTTFACSLAQRLGASHVELDALYWGPRWTPRPAAAFRRQVAEALAEPSWVCDGNYSVVRDLVWGRATALVWLDYSFARIFTRAVVRTLRRTATQEELFAGNRESLRSLLDPDWIPWWVIRTFRRRRREVPALLHSPEFTHLRAIVFRRPREADLFLLDLADRRPGVSSRGAPGGPLG